jgi:hypothetical protein
MKQEGHSGSRILDSNDMPYVPSGKNRSYESSANHEVKMWTLSYIFFFAGSELTDRRQMQKQHTVCGFKVLHHPRPTKRYELQQLWVQWSSFHPAVWSTTSVSSNI